MFKKMLKQGHWQNRSDMTHGSVGVWYTTPCTCVGVGTAQCYLRQQHRAGPQNIKTRYCCCKIVRSAMSARALAL